MDCNLKRKMANFFKSFLSILEKLLKGVGEEEKASHLSLSSPRVGGNGAQKDLLMVSMWLRPK